MNSKDIKELVLKEEIEASYFDYNVNKIINTTNINKIRELIIHNPNLKIKYNDFEDLKYLTINTNSKVIDVSKHNNLDNLYIDKAYNLEKTNM